MELRAYWLRLKVMFITAAKFFSRIKVHGRQLSLCWMVNTSLTIVPARVQLTVLCRLRSVRDGFACGGQHLSIQRTVFKYGDRPFIFFLSKCQFR